MQRRGSFTLRPALVTFFAVGAFLLVLNFSILPKSKTANTNHLACTDEAKICPDGSAVGRTGPNCEFADCPTVDTNSGSTSQSCTSDGDCQLHMCSGCLSAAYLATHPVLPACAQYGGPEYSCSCQSGVCTTIAANINASANVNAVTKTLADATAGWKTYTNTRHRYSFQYPPDWLLGNSPETSQPSPTTDDIAFDGPGYIGLTGPGTYGIFRFAVEVSTPEGCATLQTCAEGNRKVYGGDQTTNGLSSTAVSNQATLTETVDRVYVSSQYRYWVFYILKGGQLFTIGLWSDRREEDATKPILDQILSTFTFTN